MSSVNIPSIWENVSERNKKYIIGYGVGTILIIIATIYLLLMRPTKLKNSSFDCENGQCVERNGTSGRYVTKETCQRICQGKPLKGYWKCNQSSKKCEIQDQKTPFPLAQGGSRECDLQCTNVNPQQKLRCQTINNYANLHNGKCQQAEKNFTGSVFGCPGGVCPSEDNAQSCPDLIKNCSQTQYWKCGLQEGTLQETIKGSQGIVLTTNPGDSEQDTVQKYENEAKKCKIYVDSSSCHTLAPRQNNPDESKFQELDSSYNGNWHKWIKDCNTSHGDDGSSFYTFSNNQCTKVNEDQVGAQQYENRDDCMKQNCKTDPNYKWCGQGTQQCAPQNSKCCENDVKVGFCDPLHCEECGKNGCYNKCTHEKDGTPKTHPCYGSCDKETGECSGLNCSGVGGRGCYNSVTGNVCTSSNNQSDCKCANIRNKCKLNGGDNLQWFNDQQPRWICPSHAVEKNPTKNATWCQNKDGTLNIQGTQTPYCGDGVTKCVSIKDSGLPYQGSFGCWPDLPDKVPMKNTEKIPYRFY